MASTSVPAAVLPAVAGRQLARAAGRILLDVAVALAVLLLVFLAIGPRVLPYQTVTMLTGSMRPAVAPGSVVVDVAEPVSALKSGQVISFHAPTPGHPVVTHRVVDVVHHGAQVLIRTRGDANTGNDPWTAVVHGTRIWRVRAVIPELGTALRALRRPVVHLVVAWVTPAALLVWFLTGVWRRPEGGDRPCEASASPPYPSPPLHASASPGRHSLSSR